VLVTTRNDDDDEGDPLAMIPATMGDVIVVDASVGERSAVGIAFFQVCSFTTWTVKWISC